MSSKVLVIDDEPDVVAFIEAILQKDGYQTCSAPNVDEGWKAVQAEKPDLITLDILMPEKTGINFFKQIRKDPDLHNLPIVIVTGFSHPTYPNTDLETFLSRRRYVKGPDAFVTKPIEPDTLLKAVETALSPKTEDEPQIQSSTPDVL